MKTCKICGKKGLFLKLNDEKVCPDCVRLDFIKKEEEKVKQNLETLNEKIDCQENQIVQKNEQILKLVADKNDLVDQYKKTAFTEIEKDIQEKQNLLLSILKTFDEKEKLIFESATEVEKNEKTAENFKNKLAKMRSLYESLNYSIEHSERLGRLLEQEYSEIVLPTVQIHLHCMDISELRTKNNENKKAISQLLVLYRARYTTKANATIYDLMIIALEAEIQNIRYELKYGKLEDAHQAVMNMTEKYLALVAIGNQSIAPTIKAFIGQIQSLYLNAVDIEYEYYTKKEKIKEEQKALREQLRQEAAERKKLAEQQKQIEREESKFSLEIESLKESLKTALEDKQDILQKRIEELENQLTRVKDKKEEIINLQNGKAGYVYVISNLGSFGENVFKIGMTRRIEPQERVDELGSASVPFPFDVHSFIFSDDAVDLEYNLHRELNQKRINKINLRKEFFKVSLDELEAMVIKYNPSAEFKRTMIAEQFRQSLSLGDNFVYDLEKEIVNEIEDEEQKEDELRAEEEVVETAPSN